MLYGVEDSRLTAIKLIMKIRLYLPSSSHGVHPCDVTEINLGDNDREHGGRERPSN